MTKKKDPKDLKKKGRHNGYSAAEMIEAIQGAGGILAQAAKGLGCSRTTVYNYLRKFPTVQAAYDEANETALDFSEFKLMQHIRQDNLTAVIFHLKCKGKERGYVERQEISGPLGKDLKIKVSLVD